MDGVEMPKAEGPRRGAPWIVACQALWSLRTFGFNLSGAHLLGVREFGLLAMALIVHFALLRLVRAALTDTLLTRALRERIAVAEGVPLAVAFAAGAASPVGALLYVLWPTARGAALVMILLPVSALADASRMTLIASRRVASCVTLEVLWTCVAFAAVALLSITGTATVETLMLAWALSAGVHVRRFATGRRTLTTAFAQLRASSRAALHQALETVVDIACSYGALAAVAGAIGAAALGSIQAAQSATGIASFPFTTAVPVFVLVCARLEGHGRSSRGASIVMAVSSISVCGLWGVALSEVSEAGELLLGNEVWRAASPLVVPISLFVGATGAQSILNGRLRALGRSALAVRLRLISSGLLLSAAGVLPFTDSLSIIAWSFAVVGLGGTTVWMMAPGTGSGGAADPYQATEVGVIRSLTEPRRCSTEDA